MTSRTFDFHQEYHASKETWHKVYWKGLKVLKCPLDLWLYQELIWKMKPRYIIETGSKHGGSAVFFQDMLDMIPQDEHPRQVISIDVHECPHQDPRIMYITGSSTDSQVIRILRYKIQRGNTLVSLDSDHSYKHVTRELSLYGPMANYIVVEDTNIGHEIRPEVDQGPREAAKDYVALYRDFKIDHDMHKHLLSFNWGGWLKRRV